VEAEAEAEAGAAGEEKDLPNLMYSLLSLNGFEGRL